MKKLVMTTLLLFLLAGLFAQEVEYTSEDLDNYLLVVPGSHLPTKEQEVFIKSGYFIIEYENDDSLGGKVYLVRSLGLRIRNIRYAKAILIYCNEIQTRKVPAFQGFPAHYIFDEDIIIRFTGYFSKVIDSEGIESEVPIFTTK